MSGTVVKERDRGEGWFNPVFYVKATRSQSTNALQFASMPTFAIVPWRKDHALTGVKPRTKNISMKVSVGR